MLNKVEYIEIVRLLDSGGSATLYLGVDLNTGNPVAVKELNDYLFRNAYTREKFRQEANRYLELEHRNIVQLVDLILYPTRGYLIMEFIEGKNLRDYMKQVTGPLPFQNAALFIYETLNALEYAHKNSIIHLDIKPSNIMLSNQNQIKLIDFGISKTRNTVNDGVKMGTPYYMSPEQVSGTNIDERTDIYSLGITLYELITGKLPFSDTSTKEDIIKKIQKDPTPKINASLPIDREFEITLNQVIQKATDKNPQNRYQSCEAFKKAISVFV
jgi:serine/threonine-protein kinase